VAPHGWENVIGEETSEGAGEIGVLQRVEEPAANEW
jgi:hypothetical protein